MLDDTNTCKHQHGSRRLYAKLQELRDEPSKKGESFVQRIKFTTKERRLNESLGIIKERTKVLESLLGGAYASEPSVAQPSSTMTRSCAKYRPGASATLRRQCTTHSLPKAGAGVRYSMRPGCA